MNQRQINLNAELINNEIIIRLTSEDGDRKLAKNAASELFSFLERVGIKVSRENLEKAWQNKP